MTTTSSLRQITVPPEADGQRLDKWLTTVLGGPRAGVQHHIAAGQVMLGGKPVKKNHTVKSGEIFTAMTLPPPPVSTLVPQDIPLNVVHEDEAVCVINKPAGLVVHPGAGNPDGTLANAVAFRFKNLSDVGGPLRPGIVHRLDKDTSGLLLVAKTNAAHRFLSRQLADRTLSRVYWALVWGTPDPAQGEIEKRLGRHPGDRTKITVDPEGRYALTKYRVLRSWDFASELELELATGRTHQIRVHLNSNGHPVLGDEIYGGKKTEMTRLPAVYRPRAAGMYRALTRLCLHARALKFIHPDSGKELRFTAPLPPELQAVIKSLGKPAG
jgi:23S rRNA pseudouridine1911/1915/1917 synthase